MLVMANCAVLVQRVQRRVARIVRVQTLAAGAPTCGQNGLLFEQAACCGQFAAPTGRLQYVGGERRRGVVLMRPMVRMMLVLVVMLMSTSTAATVMCRAHLNYVTEILFKI